MMSQMSESDRLHCQEFIIGQLGAFLQHHNIPFVYSWAVSDLEGSYGDTIRLLAEYKECTHVQIALRKDSGLTMSFFNYE